MIGSADRVTSPRLLNSHRLTQLASGARITSESMSSRLVRRERVRSAVAIIYDAMRGIANDAAGFPACNPVF
jgi:hypothetical protein